MDPLVIIGRLQKRIKQDIELISATMVEGVDNYDNYKYLVGQARAYGTMLQEISNLLNEKEQKDNEGTVIDLTKRDPKN
jgi:hypothetical protein|tara:strand:- start:1489 stop:1725 length:237 start_codon:yes stop_codon:yes gene_type:complete